MHESDTEGCAHLIVRETSMQQSQACCALLTCSTDRCHADSLTCVIEIGSLQRRDLQHVLKILDFRQMQTK